MKKILSFFALSIIMCALCSCGISEEEKTGYGTITNNDFSAETEYDDIFTHSTDSAEADTVEKEGEEDASAVGWKQFLQEYEDWVDEYIAVINKYKENPTDFSILSDYANMMTELSEWSSKTDEMQKELESASPSEIAEYTAELARIAAKISQAAY